MALYISPPFHQFRKKAENKKNAESAGKKKNRISKKQALKQQEKGSQKKEESAKNKALKQQEKGSRKKSRITKKQALKQQQKSSKKKIEQSAAGKRQNQQKIQNNQQEIKAESPAENALTWLKTKYHHNNSCSYVWKTTRNMVHALEQEPSKHLSSIIYLECSFVFLVLSRQCNNKYFIFLHLKDEAHLLFDD